MPQMKKDISLILWVITIWLIMIVLIWVINKKNDSSFKFPDSNPKNINFPTTQLETNSWDTDIQSWNIDLSWNDINNELIKNQQSDKYDEEIKKQIELANTINISWLTWNWELCNNIDDSEKKQECLNNSYASIASTKNDINYCKKITDNEWKNRCLDSLYFDDAISKNNQTICNKILNSELKYSCLSTVIFSKISDSNYSWWSEICNSLNNSDKIYCQNKFNTTNDVEILQTAINKIDISLCKKIVSIELKTKCNDVINLKLAVSSKDQTKCLLISESNLKEQCNTTLTKILNK